MSTTAPIMRTYCQSGVPTRCHMVLLVYLLAGCLHAWGGFNAGDHWSLQSNFPTTPSLPANITDQGYVIWEFSTRQTIAHPTSHEHHCFSGSQQTIQNYRIGVESASCELY